MHVKSRLVLDIDDSTLCRRQLQSVQDQLYRRVTVDLKLTICGLTFGNNLNSTRSFKVKGNIGTCNIRLHRTGRRSHRSCTSGILHCNLAAEGLVLPIEGIAGDNLILLYISRQNTVISILLGRNIRSNGFHFNRSFGFSRHFRFLSIRNGSRST